MNDTWWKIAWKNFAGAIAFSSVMLILIASSMHFGAAKLFGLTSLAGLAIACCKTIFSKCLLDPTMLAVILPWIGFATIASGFFFAAYRAVKGLVISRQFVENLCSISCGEFPRLSRFVNNGKTRIIAFDDQTFKTAFTIGLFNPRIFVSSGLMDELTQEELNAVVSHELHHARKRDPLRLFIMSFIKDMFFYIPMGRHYLERFYITKEFAADEGAVIITGKPVDMAEALLKITRIRHEAIPAGVSILSGAKQVGKRIEALLEPGQKKNHQAKMRMAMASVTIAITLLLSVAAPIYTHAYEMKKCNHNYCLTGKDVCPAGKSDCQKMCDIMGRK
ncbi:hypothetical protein MNBD_NITROSPINAE02-996 [hydrothermal vent metagenome]|uniref:Peptidase M56 domain-containing protein n=1 Tax=hydrothermal vent metagenome TaxID=652676 RepID=A0A3B1CL18_9ZZZZ